MISINLNNYCLDPDNDDLFFYIDSTSNNENIELIGVYTHFAVSDENEKTSAEFTESQIEKFIKAKEKIPYLTEFITLSHALIAEAHYNNND